jgi:hypothetical protein
MDVWVGDLIREAGKRDSGLCEPAYHPMVVPESVSAEGQRLLVSPLQAVGLRGQQMNPYVFPNHARGVLDGADPGCSRPLQQSQPLQFAHGTRNG